MENHRDQLRYLKDSLKCPYFYEPGIPGDFEIISIFAL
jgi:hypothetical protein